MQRTPPMCKAARHRMALWRLPKSFVRREEESVQDDAKRPHVRVERVVPLAGRVAANHLCSTMYYELQHTTRCVADDRCVTDMVATI
jgi:hypothetical protein